MTTTSSNPIGLTHEQEQDYLKYSKVKQYYEIPANLAKVNAWPPLKDEYLKFKANMDSIAPIAAGTIVTSEGATMTKTQLKHLACDTVGIYTVMSRGFCLREDINMQTEAALLNWTAAKLFAIEDGSILNAVTSINNTITTKLIPLLTFTPYGIDAAKLADGLQKATDFNNSLGTAGAIKAGKTASKADVAAVFVKLLDNEVQFKHLMINFKLTDANFYNGFVAADKEDDLTKHNSVAGLVMSKDMVVDPTTNTPRNGLIPNATIKNLKSGRLVGTSPLGEYDLQPNYTGETEVEVSAPGYKKQKRVVTFKRGVTLHIDWTLEKEDGDEGSRAIAN